VNTTNVKLKEAVEARTAAAAVPAAAPAVPSFSTRVGVVNPFSLNCRFDRARGQFVVHAGARAGACAAVTVAMLALGTVAFVRSSLGPSPAGAAEAEAAAAPTTSGPSEVPATAAEPPVSAAGPKSYSEYVRTPGLNYLVIRSVPTRRAAERERDALISKGVATTVERSLPGWSGKGWYSLVGMTGFDLARDQALYDRHVKDLKDLKLEPKPYKWRER
jgi:hypothetical protein